MDHIPHRWSCVLSRLAQRGEDRDPISIEMSSWCGSSSSITFDHNGPSECFCYGIIVPIPCVILLGYLLVRYSVSSLPPSGPSGAYSKQQTLMRIMIFGCFLHPILFSSFSLLENVFPAKILAIGLHFLSWLSCAMSLYYDFHHSIPWPCTGINLYYCSSSLVCVIIVSALYSDRHTPKAFILGILVFLLSLGILILSFFKDNFLPPQQMDTKYSSVYFSEYPERTQSSFFQKLFSKKSDGSESVPFLTLDEDDESGNSTVHSTGMRWSTASEEISLVKSAMEIRLSEPDLASSSGYPMPQKELKSKQNQISQNSPPTFSSVPSAPAPIVQSKVLARILEQPQSSRAAHALSVSSKGGVIGGLAPKGPPKQDNSGGFTAASRVKSLSDGNTKVIDLHSKERIHHLENLRLLVEKWGLRRQGYGHEEKESVLQTTTPSLNDENEEHHSERFSSILRHDKNERPMFNLTTLEEAEVSESEIDLDHSEMNHQSSLTESEIRRLSSQQGQQSSKEELSSTIPLLCRAKSDPMGIPMEVEFEISLQSIIDESEDITGRGRNKKSGDETQLDLTERWIIWRTGKELLSLHAVLVSKFGDLAPRRPKLQTYFPSSVSIENQFVTREMMFSDMRLIAGYLRAVISQPLFHCPALYSFLEIPVSLLPTANSENISGFRVDFEENENGAGISTSPETSHQIPTIQEIGGISRNRSAGTTDQSAESNRDQWRKVFLNLRKNLKPREIAVRCRVFDGVISGADIVKWMINPANNYAHDHTEACMISQGLVVADLLTPVCLGYRNITDVDEDFETNQTFSNEKGYIYRYPGRSNRVGAYTLFGAPVSVAIPRWIQVDGDGNVSAAGGKDNQGAPWSGAGLVTIKKSAQTVNPNPNRSAGYVQYTMDVTVGDDHWEVMRRYNEFSQFHRNLQKEKVKPSAQFPSTSFSQLMMGQMAPVGEAKMDQRRLELEIYFRSAIEAILLFVIQFTDDQDSSPSDDSSPKYRLLTLLAEFLDDDHTRLRLYHPKEHNGNGEIPIDSHSSGIGEPTVY